MQKLNVYLASSWRNERQPEILSLIRDEGYDVYDFKNPEPGNEGFRWSEIDPDWKNWTPQKYRDALRHPIAQKGYQNDITALNQCDVCVLLLPSGRSASWELGYAMGKGRMGIVCQFDNVEPELMYLEAPLVTTTKELLESLKAADDFYKSMLGHLDRRSRQP